MSDVSKSFLINPRHADFAAGHTRWLPMSEEILFFAVLLAFGAVGAVMAWSVHPAAYFERYGFVRAVPQIIGLVLGAALMVLPCAAATTIISNLRRNISLSRHGKIVAGEVVDCELLAGDSQNERRVRLRYAFKTPSGKRLTRAESFRWQYADDSAPPKQGTPIHVLFASEDLWRVL